MAGVGDLSDEVAGTHAYLHDSAFKTWLIGLATGSEWSVVYTSYGNYVSGPSDYCLKSLSIYYINASEPIWVTTAGKMPLHHHGDIAGSMSTIYVGGTPLRAIDRNGKIKWTLDS